MPEGDFSAGAATSEDSGAAVETGGVPESPSVNPNWTPVLEQIPTEFHSKLIPSFQQWDQNYQRDTQQVQAKYSPYAEFIDNEVDPQQLSTALQLYQLMETQPNVFYEQFGNYYGLNTAQGQGGTPQGQEIDDFNLEEKPAEIDIENHPKFKELMQNQGVMAQYLEQQIQQKAEAEAEAELDQEYDAFKKSHEGLEINKQQEELLWQVYSQDGVETLDQAFEFLSKAGLFAQPEPAPPVAPSVVSPSSGGVPSTQVNPRSFNRSQVNNTVVDYLKALHEQG